MMDKLKIRHAIIFSLKVLPLFLVAVWLLSLAWIGLFKSHPVKTTPEIWAYTFFGKKDSLVGKVGHRWIPLDSISRNLVVAVMAAEDRNFFVHGGFSPSNDTDSVARPHDFLDQETISQRTANAVFLFEGKSWFHRLSETYYTVMIEEFWDKNRILEVYLNSAMMGRGIFGADAASRFYFQKSAGELTRDEASFIAAAMDNPLGLRSTQASDSLLVTKKKRILENMDLMMNVKIGKNPVDEEQQTKDKSTYRPRWRG